MAISPEGFIQMYKGMGYGEILPIRDKYIKIVQDMEAAGIADAAAYKLNLQYLAKLYELCAQKYDA